ncbi:MAG TPA: stage V sporulation protein AC [Ruminococcaceae bacterium]|nr:stage V sporulation protein AC [Oscillospiraceae bacterium]
MVSPKEYDKIVKASSPKSNTLINCAKAFVFGGAICAVGQVVFELISAAGFDEDTSKTLTSVCMIALGVLLTVLGVYDKIARHAGAGTLVPITGFANAMSSPAIEFKSEGFVTGVGTKLFAIAGPVIVYTAAASALYGAVLWILHMFGITLF